MMIFIKKKALDLLNNPAVISPSIVVKNTEKLLSCCRKNIQSFLQTYHYRVSAGKMRFLRF